MRWRLAAFHCTRMVPSACDNTGIYPPPQPRTRLQNIFSMCFKENAVTCQSYHTRKSLINFTFSYKMLCNCLPWVQTNAHNYVTFLEVFIYIRDIGDTMYTILFRRGHTKVLTKCYAMIPPADLTRAVVRIWQLVDIVNQCRA